MSRIVLLAFILAFSLTAKASKPVDPQVEITTSAGVIVVELYESKAPKTVENFLNYTRSSFFNGTIFHRVIDSFMIQGGGFTSDMKIKDTGAPIKNEARNGLKNAPGTLAMARTNNPDSATSQFFINLVENSMLDYPKPDGAGYAVFGKVIKGMDVVQKIAKVPTGSGGIHSDVPLTPVTIETVKILPQP